MIFVILLFSTICEHQFCAVYFNTDSNISFNAYISSIVASDINILINKQCNMAICYFKPIMWKRDV